MLDVGRLATLRAVLDHGSFSAAASALALTQPAVSRQIALLERQVGTQLVVRSRAGARPTEAGRVLAAHAGAVLARLALAEEQLAELAGARRGRIRLGSFFTALVQVSPQLCARLDRLHPGLEVEDRLVDRTAALAGVARGELDLAIVFEHDFEPAGPPPDGVELVALWDDPARVLLPAAHPLAARHAVDVRDLAATTWIRPHAGSAARLVDHVLATAGIDPPRMLAGRGDEPVESQVLVAAGAGVTIAHELNVLVGGGEIAARPLAGPAPLRRVQAAVAEGQAAPAPRAALEALRWCAQSRSGRSG
jgi:DNA-binding transcriptional LysR family regulator